MCAVEGCGTILSRFNKTDLCGIHEDVPRSAQSVRTHITAVLDTPAATTGRSLMPAGVDD